MSNRISMFAVFIALAFIFSYIETLIPFSFGIPGIKLGLANVIIVIVLYHYGTKDAFFISLLRILLVGLTFGSLATMLYSLAGGLFSLLIMVMSKKIKKFSIMGVSILGGTFHNIGQLAIAIFIVNTSRLLYYAPVLILSGTATGFVIGYFANASLKRWKPNNNS